jgi:hypothetical protein
MSSSLWIDCECPVTGGSWDEEAIVGPDTVIRCQSCGEPHRIGSIGTLLRQVGRHTLETVPEDDWRIIADTANKGP